MKLEIGNLDTKLKSFANNFLESTDIDANARAIFVHNLVTAINNLLTNDNCTDEDLEIISNFLDNVNNNLISLTDVYLLCGTNKIDNISIILNLYNTLSTDAFLSNNIAVLKDILLSNVNGLTDAILDKLKNNHVNNFDRTNFVIKPTIKYSYIEDSSFFTDLYSVYSDFYNIFTTSEISYTIVNTELNNYLANLIASYDGLDFDLLYVADKPQPQISILTFINRFKNIADVTNLDNVFSLTTTINDKTYILRSLFKDMLKFYNNDKNIYANRNILFNANNYINKLVVDEVKDITQENYSYNLFKAIICPTTDNCNKIIAYIGDINTFREVMNNNFYDNTKYSAKYIIPETI